MNSPSWIVAATAIAVMAVLVCLFVEAAGVV